MSVPLLQMEDVRVAFGSLVAVGGVSMSLDAGQLLGLVGPNGAGKTTLLRVCAGLQPAHSGWVRVMGYDVETDPTSVGRRLGFTPDVPAVYETLRVEEYLRFIGDCYSLSRTLCRERIDHWLEQLWIAEKRTARIGTLSRGTRQRVAVARTLLPDPHVVLLDEPAAGLDPAGRVQFRQLLARLRDMGKAIVVSSHILADLSEYCTHIAFMERGRVRRFGAVDQIARGDDHARTRYHVVLAQPVDDLAARLAELGAGRVLGQDADEFTVEHDADRPAAAALLRRLFEMGLPIAEFHAARLDLEQAYLQSGIEQVD